jgi:predicted nucleotidyltransferase
MNSIGRSDIKNLLDIFTFYPQVKLAYFFGSRAKGKAGPLSDYDFAVYLDEKDKKQRFEIKLGLMAKLSHELATDEVDVVVLNDTESPELQYSIVREGKLIYEEEPYKVSLEPRILNEYFDFMYGLRKYGLTDT